MALLDAAPLLLDRLKAVCRSATGGVKCEDDLAGVLATAQRDKSLYLVLYDYAPQRDDGESETRWREIWLVIAVVRQVAADDAWQKAFAAARPLLADVLRALDGWRRRPELIGPVKAEPGPRPKIADGFAYFPLAFSVDTVTSGVEDAEV